MSALSTRSFSVRGCCRSLMNHLLSLYSNMKLMLVWKLKKKCVSGSPNLSEASLRYFCESGKILLILYYSRESMGFQVDDVQSSVISISVSVLTNRILRLWWSRRGGGVLGCNKIYSVGATETFYGEKYRAVRN